MNHASNRQAKRIKILGTQTARLAFTVVFAFPLIFMFVSSLKPDNQIFADLTSLRAILPVGDISLDNYRGVFERVPAGRMLLNSIGISLTTVVLGILVNSMAAFAMARMRWRASKILLTGVIATLIVPFETFALPLLWWVNKLPALSWDGAGFVLSQGWLDGYTVQVLPFVANAFSIFFFYQFFKTIPVEIDEAARVDGASWFSIYWRILMPLSGPAIATVAILSFLLAWNQYLWPLMVVQTEDYRPVMVGIQYFFQLNVSWGQIMAYATMITVPVLAFFLAFQRAFISSIASAGVKG